MINKNKIFAHLDAAFERVKELNEKHKVSVEKAIDWFEDKALDKSIEEFAGSKIKINNVTAVCVESSFIGAPIFECYFIFRPAEFIDDCGSGAGCSHTVEF